MESCHVVQEPRRGHSPGDPESDPASLQQIIRQQRQDEIGGHEFPTAVHHAEAIGIAVRGQAEVGASSAHLAHERRQLFLTAVGREAPERHVPLRPDAGHFRGRAEERREVVASCPMQRIADQLQLAPGDEARSEVLLHRLPIIGGRIQELERRVAQGWSG